MFIIQFSSFSSTSVIVPEFFNSVPFSCATIASVNIPPRFTVFPEAISNVPDEELSLSINLEPPTKKYWLFFPAVAEFATPPENSAAPPF